MRSRITAAVLGLLGAWSLCGAARPQASGAAAPADVIACADLVDLRLLMGSVHDDRAAAARRLAEHPGCRTVARARIGEARNRAMIGGAPFECLAIRDEGACGWVMP